MQLVERVFFALAALLTLGGAIATVAARRPIRGAMGLLTTILGICGCYLLLHAEFLATIQLIVYAGAVVILFIFVVMLLGSSAESPADGSAALPRYLAAGVFVACVLGAGTLMLRVSADRGKAAVPAVAEHFGTIEKIGRELFTEKVIPFELTGALLLVAVVGALAVGRGKQADPTLEPADPSTQDGGKGEGSAITEATTAGAASAHAGDRA
ncbi:MAG: NADH-quinone oxidoreductase subunit J [Deltaproteobacteria bacterium]|nr:NADH-quinone oxidoreductase subunit J [Deltaproteobacteria bacterium]